MGLIEHKIYIYLMTGHHTTRYGRIQYVAQAASKPDRDTSGKNIYRDTGIQEWRRRLYCDCQVDMDPSANLGGNCSVKSLARRVVEPRVPDKGSCRLCDDLPKNGPELDA